MGAVLIVNPRASKVSEEVVERVLAALPAGVEVLRTGAAGEATALAREREASAEAIYVLGGDGTYNEVLNGVTRPVPLGFLPGGGTSVLPRALGLGRDPVAAARLAAGGVERAIGLGRVNGRRFSFNAGVGFDAELVRRIDVRGRAADGRRPGDAAFVREAIGLVTASRGTVPGGARDRGRRSRGVRARRELQPLHVRRAASRPRRTEGVVRRRPGRGGTRAPSALWAPCGCSSRCSAGRRRAVG